MEDIKLKKLNSEKKNFFVENEITEYKNFIKFLLSADQIQYWIGRRKEEK